MTPKRTLALLLVLFLLPLGIAFLVYYGTAWRPGGHVNHGYLFTPARPLPAIALASGERFRPALRGEWSLVYVGDGGCDPSCRKALHVMRQTRLALGRDMTRVAPVFLVTGNCCTPNDLAREHPGLVVLDASRPAAQPLLREFTAGDSAEAYTLYVVDPLGNLVMSFDARSDLRGLLEDLQKLLRLSHIG
ncbi:MAG: cytochrome oxidase assembly protein [Gammaproteobacteria bacterium]|nr:cytochrome oxidase assembly protein [Gammaproteobacteria bacterium]